MFNVLFCLQIYICLLRFVVQLASAAVVLYTLCPVKNDTPKLVVCRCRYLTSVSVFGIFVGIFFTSVRFSVCLLYTSDAADE